MKHDEITRIRLHGWKQRLAEYSATPVIMLGVGIEGKDLGKVVLLCTEERTNAELRLLLASAIQQLANDVNK